MNKTVKDFKETIIQFVEDLCIAEETKRRARKVTTEALETFIEAQRQTLRDEIGKIVEKEVYLNFVDGTVVMVKKADVLSVIDKI